jgi:hypothetical protein
MSHVSDAPVPITHWPNMRHKEAYLVVLWSAIVAVLAASCASQQPWYWVNRFDPERPLEGDRSRCALVGYQAGQQGAGMQAIIAQQLAFENCMAAVGWVKQSGIPQASPVPIASQPEPATVAQDRVVLIGGPDRAIYLGCVSCPQSDAESVFNPTGSFGSPVSQTSIFNPIGPYGSPISQYSVCNPVAASPPVLIDTARRVRGVLTLNPATPGAVTDERILAWLREMCSGAS